jgi:hypothetical protein
MFSDHAGREPLDLSRWALFRTNYAGLTCRGLLLVGNAMRKRTRRLVGLLVCGVAAVAATVWFSGRPAGINRNGYSLIREGMTLEDVSAILGKLPGDYTTTEREQAGIVEPEVKWWQHDHQCFSGENWIADYGSIWVGFSEDGKAVGKHFHAHRPGLGNFLGWLRELVRF